MGGSGGLLRVCLVKTFCTTLFFFRALGQQHTRQRYLMQLVFPYCTLSTIQVDEPRLEGDGVDDLLDQARNAGDPFLAVTLYQRVLQARPNDTTVMGEAADLMLHAGETEAAKEVDPSCSIQDNQ